MKRMYLLGIFLCLTISSTLYGQIIEEAPFSIGERLTMQSDILGEERVLNVYLPSSYKDSLDRQYPVIYLLDGSKDEDFIHIAGLVQFGSFSWINMVPESIVVGIENVDRKRDFTYPSRDALDRKDFPTSGGSENFVNFLEKELIPFVTSRYKVVGQSTLIGQSLGGLLAADILMKKPDVFDTYFIVSPSIWWSKYQIFDESLSKPTKKKNVYVAVGKEGKVMTKGAKKLYKKLKKEGKGFYRLHFKYFPECDHGDTLHKAVYEGFETIWGESQR